MPWLRRVCSPYRTRAQLVIILSMWVLPMSSQMLCFRSCGRSQSIEDAFVPGEFFFLFYHFLFGMVLVIRFDKERTFTYGENTVEILLTTHIGLRCHFQFQRRHSSRTDCGACWWGTPYKQEKVSVFQR